MDTHADQQPSQPVAVNPAYAADRLAKALATAGSHPHAATRERAAARGERWRAVLSGIAEGRLSIGSRTPVRGLPAWVTPEVVRGGFATGTASASGPFLPHETQAAQRFGIPATRGALFAHALTGPGLDALFALLDSGRYEVTVPEEAALLTVAWLVRAGDVAAAADLVEALSPHIDTLRFLPRPSTAPAGRADLVHRRTAGDARASLEARLPHTAVETQREALTVWNPFSDELLAHWLTDPDDAWYAHGDTLLRRYRALAAEHTLCTKHRDPKGNVGILVGALTEVCARRSLDARRAGLVRTAVGSMVRKRGLPGSERHTALRGAQSAQAALPGHHALAHLAARRLAVLPQETGVEDTGPLVTEVSAREAEESGLPAGSALPAPVRRVVEGTLSAPLATLVERRLVPSAEVLAGLVPQLVASTTARTYEDGPLRTLAAATYRAFRNRRSLLLFHLVHQVRADELPWVRAVSAHKRPNADSARDALRELGGTAVRAFPGTLPPNPLVRELSVLARQAELDAPFVEELAADIFMGTFSPKFLKAAQVAAEVLEGTLYARYYGIDYAALRAPDADGPGRNAPRTAPDFAALCAARAGGDSAHSWSVAANGKVIEQAQILTTHNLATLVHRVSIDPGAGWDALALRCYAEVCRRTAQVRGNPRPLATVKDAAYAWRQMLFHLSLCEPGARDRVLAALEDETGRFPQHVADRVRPAVEGLRLLANGGEFDEDGTADGGRARRFLGWSTGGHWMLELR
ncbi:hypothetical protein [Streptomyces candidus]|uniref:Uncharacterized protein n=1 Tax=Streptomyces candidus TaxID=67283 RepID=A0A7X0HEF6_9ACTN|nr:hypothetical protein [Streptomyces candidus]MBB6436115.1 hypothetical protein [Streptomyces candidus]GHH43673.1 hypothetical protein GCM10018773_30190 [Streptomyces candidus]